MNIHYLIAKARAKKIKKLADKIKVDMTRYYDHYLYHARRPGENEEEDSYYINKIIANL